MEKIRLDTLLLNSGKVDSRSQAQRLVMAGQIRVNGQMILKSSIKVPSDAEIQVIHLPRYVSRGGEKLESALIAFGMTDISGWVCADVGASTGGFTDCLLQHGANRVYAIDVGYGIVHWKLRTHPKVQVLERTNARYLGHLAEEVDLITIDASFISLSVLLPVVKNWFSKNGGRLIILIKPQFEAGRAEAAKGEGVIRDPLVHQSVIQNVFQKANTEGYEVNGIIKSPLIGPKGNIEFLAFLTFPLSNIENAFSFPSMVSELFM